MTSGLAALLAGAFGVPAALLWAGHRLRRRPRWWRAAFWGALAGHLAAVPLATLAALVPPAAWSPADTWRGLFGLWALVALPAVGAAIAVLVAGRRGPR